ncbi:hypothetical protein FF38_04669 [Lucilia cuprina]|uniref:Ap4A phosphorylase 1/2 N-terminal domain-containing protein n=1 Tax=Lucilia cuprina TaxID=7375 RepID=A0A0L0CE97_LUCCU|nr:hypothetical protein FF38_04669 [Lucilia cuprina]
MHLEIEKKFEEAVENNKLTFTESTQERKTLDNGLQLAITLASNLSKKPESDGSAGESKSSPWLPVDGDLLVQKQDTHSLVLNKFPVVKNHVLLVTNEFEDQNLPLSEADWKSSLALLKQLNEGTGKRHVGFFNCGSNSGASVSHKHIQFMPLPENFSPFPDTTKEAKDTGMYGDERVPFAHYITKIPDDLLWDVENATSGDIPCQSHADLRFYRLNIEAKLGLFTHL